MVLDRLAEPFKTMLVVAMWPGLGVSEIQGLQWADFQLGGAGWLGWEMGIESTPKLQLKTLLEHSWQS